MFTVELYAKIRHAAGFRMLAGGTDQIEIATRRVGSLVASYVLRRDVLEAFFQRLREDLA
jgi:hypothetical protein